MDLIAWLEDLAAAYRIEPSEMTTRRYLKFLERWHLAPEQWEQLSDHAVAELNDIASELQHQAQIKANSEWIARISVRLAGSEKVVMVNPENVVCDEEVADLPRHSEELLRG